MCGGERWRCTFAVCSLAGYQSVVVARSHFAVQPHYCCCAFTPFCCCDAWCFLYGLTTSPTQQCHTTRDTCRPGSWSVATVTTRRGAAATAAASTATPWTQPCAARCGRRTAPPPRQWRLPAAEPAAAAAAAVARPGAAAPPTTRRTRWRRPPPRPRLRRLRCTGLRHWTCRPGWTTGPMRPRRSGAPSHRPSCASQRRPAGAALSVVWLVTDKCR